MNHLNVLFVWSSEASLDLYRFVTLNKPACYKFKSESVTGHRACLGGVFSKAEAWTEDATGE